MNLMSEESHVQRVSDRYDSTSTPEILFTLSPLQETCTFDTISELLIQTGISKVVAIFTSTIDIALRSTTFQMGISKVLAIFTSTIDIALRSTTFQTGISKLLAIVCLSSDLACRDRNRKKNERFRARI